MPPKKSKNPPKKKQRLLCDVGAPWDITITSKYEKYKGVDLLMTDIIYGKKLPMEAQGKLLWYKVREFDKDKEVFTLEYQCQAIDADVDGSEFTAFDEQTTEAFLKNIDLEEVKNGQKRYSTVTTRTKRAKADKDDEISKELTR